MPRWPAGLHAQSGSGVAYGYRPLRTPATPQEHYWRRTATALHASGQSPLPFFLGNQPTASVTAFAGPQGAGEQWLVDLVHVQAPLQYGQPPLVVQQVIAQNTGTTTTPPPPVTAQAWLTIGTVNVHLLAQTGQGGNDDLTVACPLLSPGEGITVIWWGLPFTVGSPAWFTVRGTRYTLSPV